MATAVARVVVLPISSALHDSASLASAREVNLAAVRSWNGASTTSERLLRRRFGESRKKLYISRCENAAYVVKEVTDADLEKQVQPDDIRVLAAIKSSYNYITVMEVASEADHLLAGARMLLLDNPGCIHTVYYERNVLTNSYYDALATVVPLLPAGPVGVLGLGAGAVAHIVHHFFPTREMHGWEVDPDVITIARQFFRMTELESSSSGKLTVHVGDALSLDVCVEDGFAGLIVDLFAEGRVIPALQQPETWHQLKAKLKSGGRIIVNCGGDRVRDGEETRSAGQRYMEETIAAMGEVFPGELSSRYLARKGFNTVAITGPAPNVEAWTRALPAPLHDGIAEWKLVLRGST